MRDVPQQVLTWSSGLAILVFCLTGLASMLGWLPSSLDNSAGTPVRQAPLLPTECLNCGVISATCVLDMADEDEFMVGLINVSGVLGPGLVTAVSGEAEPVSDKTGGRHYQTTVRFNNGTTRTFAATDAPKWQVGERVRVSDGIIGH